MSRLSKEREERIRRYHTYLLDNQLTEDVSSLLGEIDALRRERDEAIAEAYRAAAMSGAQDAQIIVTSLGNIESTMAEEAPESFCGKVSQDYGRAMRAAMNITKRILALTPQSALDAVERDRREIAETALAMTDDCLQIHPCKQWPTADDVLAKVKRA